MQLASVNMEFQVSESRKELPVRWETEVVCPASPACGKVLQLLVVFTHTLGVGHRAGAEPRTLPGWEDGLSWAL